LSCFAAYHRSKGKDDLPIPGDSYRTAVAYIIMFADAGLVFQSQKHKTFCRARPLPNNNPTGDTHRAAIAQLVNIRSAPAPSLFNSADDRPQDAGQSSIPCRESLHPFVPAKSWEPEGYSHPAPEVLHTTSGSPRDSFNLPQSITAICTSLVQRPTSNVPRLFVEG